MNTESRIENQRSSAVIRVPSAEKSLKMLWKAIYWVSFPFGILTFVLPVYGKDLGASALEIGGFYSAMFIVPVVVRPFLGRALDRWGRRPFLLLGLAGYALAMIVFSFASTVALLTAARFVQGLGTAFLWLSATTIVADLAEDSNRGQEFGSIDEAANRGGIIGTTLGFTIMGVLSEMGLGWRQMWLYIFAFYALFALIGLWRGWKGVPETRPAIVNVPVEKRPFSGQLLALMGIVLFTGASTAMVWPLLVVFLQDVLQAEFWVIGIAYLPAALLSASLPSRMGRISDRLGRKTPMMIGLLISALASALMPHLPSVWLLTILWALESLGVIIAAPAERAFVADIAGEDARGASYGWYTFAYFFGAVLGPLAGGWLYDNFGHAAPFYLNAGVLLLGSILVLTILRETRRTL